MGSKNPNFGKKLSEKTRKKMSVARKGGNEGSFKKGEHRSRKTEFKKNQIPHNKGVLASPELRAKNSASQKKRWDRIGRQSKEELDRKERERMRKKRTNPNFRLKERERDRIYRLKPGVRERQNQEKYKTEARKQTSTKK